ncbi:hypothetical protein JI59_08455 [Novosphingobium pentaromativorans US6-1]|nr:hypothetical protein JI59_08455 [Novosphingobium pentaromativorans US6-1]
MARKFGNAPQDQVPRLSEQKIQAEKPAVFLDFPGIIGSFVRFGCGMDRQLQDGRVRGWPRCFSVAGLLILPVY